MDIAGVITAISATREMLDAAIRARDDIKIRAATDSFTRSLIDIQNICLLLQKDKSDAIDAAREQKDRIRELEDAIAAMRKQAADRERYMLNEPYLGTFAYVPRDATAGNEPVHYLCQPCMDNEAKKSVLQVSPDDYTARFCPSCKTTYQFQEWHPG